MSKCFASPEALKEKILNFRSDVWSLGCVLYFMATKKNPWSSETRNRDLKKTLLY
jgi:serine/threonine protein kinase